ncbi:threonine/serine exporter family protein [Corynebacterium amycolatum]|uniref:threonine/serine exporter ThrE n=1 Tax=Corynebacterium amycolatum TaxID=43765 RepID=UPI00254CA319|nr:threonine/serine exporter family protein [Corynebacterium amycolatum]MDK8819032.1 threonine/serine exporter family protein [Corynebacterium amycolatum]
MPFDGGNKSNAEENSAAKDDAYDAEAAVAYPADPTVSYDDTPQTQFPAIDNQSAFKQRVIDFVSGPTATVDLVHSTTTPLPLAPIDYSDPSQVTAVLDLAARIGGLLLACGSGNRDTELQIKTVTSAYGLTQIQVDITLTSVTVYHLIGARRTPITAMRVVTAPVPDFERLRHTDRVIRRIRAGHLSLEEAIEAIDKVEREPAKYRLRVIYAGWALLASSVTVLLGSGFEVALIAAAVTLAIVIVIGELAARELPTFFQNAVGGLIATLSAAVLNAAQAYLPFEMQPSRLIASGIIVMLAGLTLVQALQDGITGAPVTGSARFFDTMLLTGGIVAGIAMGIEFSGMLGIPLPDVIAGSDLNLAQATVRVIAGTTASIAFALASNAGFTALSVSGTVALLGSMTYYYVLTPLGVHPVTSAGAAATLIGLIGGLLARRWSIPPLITAVAGVTPLLPGMTIYRGMHALLHDHPTKGFTALASALGIATALAAGIVLGEWMARRLRRPRALREDSGLTRPIRAGMRRIRPVNPRNKPRRPRNYRFKGGMNPRVD